MNMAMERGRHWCLAGLLLALFGGVYFIINGLVYFIYWNIITLNGSSVVVSFLFD